jgi:hypothetical protein
MPGTAVQTEVANARSPWFESIDIVCICEGTLNQMCVCTFENFASMTPTPRGEIRHGTVRESRGWIDATDTTRRDKAWDRAGKPQLVMRIRTILVAVAYQEEAGLGVRLQLDQPFYK